MSASLAQLLGKTDIAIGSFIGGMENMSGYPAEDNRLLSEVIAGSIVKVGDLGLDPADTTGRELYHALMIRYRLSFV
jgi:hypothetical protein